MVFPSFFVAQLYLYIIMPFIPTMILQGFINFILNPATILLDTRGVEANLAQPIIITINAMWNYFLGTILAKEIDHEK